MPLWLTYVLLAVAAIVIVYLIYLVVTNKRWYRLYAFTGLATAYFSAPSLRLIIQLSGLEKKLGINVNAVLNESSWARELICGMIFAFLFILENNFTKGESHHKLQYEFQTVVIDNLRDGIEAVDIAKKRKILLEKVEAIIACLVWLESKPHKKKSRNGNTN